MPASLVCADVIARGNGFIEAAIDGEVVALNIEKGNCYGLNKVGSRIWALLEQPKSIAELCTQLVSEYRIDQATCEQQVLDLLEELRNEGMVEKTGPAA